MISLVKIYREMFENKQKQANDLTKQLEDLRAENDALRQKNADLNNQILEHVKKCLCCKNLNFTQEIKFLNHKISELREENARLKELIQRLGSDIEGLDIKKMLLIVEVNNLKGFLKECHNQLSKFLIDGAEPKDGEIIKFLTKIEEILK